MSSLTTLILVLPPQGGLLEGFASGLISLANFVENKVADVRVQLLDLSRARAECLTLDIKAICRQTGNRLFVGITTTTASYQSALKVARMFKEDRPDSVVVLGGHHASPEALIILETHQEIDFVIRGEGEIAIAELLKSYPSISKVPNLVYRTDGGTIAINGSAPLLQPEVLDTLAPLYDNGERRSALGKFDHVTYVSARGCPLQCAFCAVANEPIRNKSVPVVAHDLKFLVGTCGFQRIAIEDNFFAHSPRRTMELCASIEAIQREHSFKWDCQTRVESLRRDDVVAAMARAGCEAAYIGVEAFDHARLLYLGKTNNPEAYVHALETDVVPRLLQHNISCYINLQMGFPGEDSREMGSALRSLTKIGRLAKKAGTRITIFPQLHVVYPGTRHWHLYTTRPELGPLPVDLFESFTAWEAEQEPVLRWLGKHFAHGTGGIPIGILDGRSLRAKRDLERYVVSPESVMGIENHLDDLSSLTGVEIFRYSPFLTNHAI